MEGVWPGKFQLLWSPPEPVATYFLGHFSSTKQLQLLCFGASRHGGPLYLLNRTYGTRTADTEDESHNTQSWWDELCLHVSCCWPQYKDSDHLEKRTKMIKIVWYTFHSAADLILTSVYYLSPFIILNREKVYYHQYGQQRAQSSRWGWNHFAMSSQKHLWSSDSSYKGSCWSYSRYCRLAEGKHLQKININ